MDGRKSERPIVPMSPGNRTLRDPEEGRGRRGMEPMEGKMERALDLGSVLTRLRRIAELVQPAGVRRPTVEQRNHAPEEPDAGIPHVRICGGLGRVTARVYPTPFILAPFLLQYDVTFLWLTPGPRRPTKPRRRCCAFRYS